jgi:hypothetical protein
MARGYETWDTPGAGFEIISLPPAGSLSSSGDDMAHFMIAHLQLGRYGAAQILPPDTARMMHTTAWKAFPDLNGNLLGFYQQNINGHRVIAHAGDTNDFHSDLTLYIDDNVGVFISVNGKGKDGMGEFVRDSLFAGFADRYFPPAVPDAPTRVDPATAKAHAAMIAGSYITTRRSDSTFLALIQLIQPSVVTADADGTISAAPLGEKETYFETSPFIWRQVNGHDRLQGIVEDGKVTRWSTDAAAPIFVFVRPAGFAGTGLAPLLSLLALGFLALIALLWPVIAIVRWRYRAAFALLGARAWAFRLTRLAAVLAVAAVALWAGVILVVSGTTGDPAEGLLHAAQAVSVAAFGGGAIVALWNLALALASRGAWFAKAFATLAAAAFGFMLWVALTYHLIGFSGQY